MPNGWHVLWKERQWVGWDWAASLRTVSKCGTATEGREGDTEQGTMCVQWLRSVAAWGWRRTEMAWLSSANPLPTFFTNRVPFYLERQWDKSKHISQPSLYPRVACEQPMRCKPKSIGGPSRKVLFVSVRLFVGAFTWRMPLALSPFSLLERRRNAWSRADMLWPQGSKHEDKSHKLIKTEWGARKSLLWCTHQPCGFLLWEKK